MPQANQTLDQRYPLRLPPDYIRRKIAELLPPVNIRQLSGDQLKLYDSKVRDLIELITLDPVRFFKPSPGGQWDFLTCNDPHIQGLYFFAGNKTGKTTGAAVLIGENCTGQPAWGRDTRSPRDLLLKGRNGIRACVFCEDFNTHEETIIPTLLTWAQRKYLAPTPLTYGPSGNALCANFANGSHLYFRTYDQGYAKAEGKDYDLVWCDEPPNRSIYTAIFRGLVATRGRLIIAATLLSETWLYDELVQPFIRVFEASIYQNPWLDDQARRNFEATLSEDERLVRIEGKPSALSGKVYASFQSRYPFVLPYVYRPYDPTHDEPFPIIMGVDPHERKGLFCEWGWLTPTNGIIWFDWAIIQPATLTEQFRQIEAIEQRHEGRTRLVVMDPNSGKRKQIDDRNWEDEFTDRDYEVLLGIDKLDYGIARLREMLNPNCPSMVWLESCQGKGGPLYQMERYIWDDHPRATRYEKPVKEEPKKLYSDWPDIHRYVACAELDFVSLTRGAPPPVSIYGNTTKPVNPYA